MKITRTALLLIGLVLVAACGTKGPLVMPEKADKPEKTDQTESPAAP
jgi:predicted small lipoprotein YifL